MRRIARHPQYQARVNELADKYPEFLEYIERLERFIAEDPNWPISIYVPAHDCWWSHFLLEDESIPHMRVFHNFDDQEMRFLAIVLADPA
jgi:hypothetical protein